MVLQLQAQNSLLLKEVADYKTRMDATQEAALKSEVASLRHTLDDANVKRQLLFMSASQWEQELRFRLSAQKDDSRFSTLLAAAFADLFSSPYSITTASHITLLTYSLSFYRSHRNQHCQQLVHSVLTSLVSSFVAYWQPHIPSLFFLPPPNRFPRAASGTLGRPQYLGELLGKFSDLNHLLVKSALPANLILVIVRAMLAKFRLLALQHLLGGGGTPSMESGLHLKLAYSEASEWFATAANKHLASTFEEWLTLNELGTLLTIDASYWATDGRSLAPSLHIRLLAKLAAEVRPPLPVQVVTELQTRANMAEPYEILPPINRPPTWPDIAPYLS